VTDATALPDPATVADRNPLDRFRLDDRVAIASGQVGQKDPQRPVTGGTGRAVGDRTTDEAEPAEHEALDERTELLVVGQRADRGGTGTKAPGASGYRSAGPPVVARPVATEADEEYEPERVGVQYLTGHDLARGPLGICALQRLEGVDTDSRQRRFGAGAERVVIAGARARGTGETDGQDCRAGARKRSLDDVDAWGLGLR